jgi:hypothetical protein
MFYKYYMMKFYPESFAHILESLNDLTLVSNFTILTISKYIFYMQF